MNLVKDYYFKQFLKQCPELVNSIQIFHAEMGINSDIILTTLRDKTLTSMFLRQLIKFSIDFHYFELLAFALDKEIQFIESESKSPDECIINTINAMQSRRWNEIEISSILTNKKIKPLPFLDKVIPFLSSDIRQSVFDWIVEQVDFMSKYNCSLKKCISFGIQNESLFGDSVRGGHFDVARIVLQNRIVPITADMVRDIVQTGNISL